MSSQIRLRVINSRTALRALMQRRATLGAWSVRGLSSMNADLIGHLPTVLRLEQQPNRSHSTPTHTEHRE